MGQLGKRLGIIGTIQGSHILKKIWINKQRIILNYEIILLGKISLDYQQFQVSGLRWINGNTLVSDHHHDLTVLSGVSPNSG